MAVDRTSTEKVFGLLILKLLVTYRDLLRLILVYTTINSLIKFILKLFTQLLIIDLLIQVFLLLDELLSIGDSPSTTSILIMHAVGDLAELLLLGSLLLGWFGGEWTQALGCTATHAMKLIGVVVVHHGDDLVLEHVTAASLGALQALPFNWQLLLKM